MKFVNFSTYLLFICFIFKNVQTLTLAEKALIKSKMFSMAIECMQSNPLTLNEIKSFKSNVFPDGENPKCFMACLYKKIGIIDDMGMLSPANVRKNGEMVFKGGQDLQNLDEFMKSCLYVNEQKTRDGNKGCDRAKLAYPCFSKNSSKYGFHFA